MPNRILRDCTDSDRINSLDCEAERFFYRLIMIVDDFGRYFSHPSLLRSRMFPLKVDEISDKKIEKLIAKCENAGLILIYEVNNKSYLQINEFNQRLRIKNVKYPEPPENVGHHVGHHVVKSDSRNETKQETKLETETRNETEALSCSFVSPNLESYIQTINSTFGRSFKPNKKLIHSLNARIKEGYTLEDFKTAMQNACMDKFHQDNSFKHCTPEFFLRVDKLEKWLNAVKITANASQLKDEQIKREFDEMINQTKLQ